MVCRFRQLAPLDKPHYECYDECKAKKYANHQAGCRKPCYNGIAIMIDHYTEGGNTMQKFEVLTAALAYIESHLDAELSREQIAASCYISLSSLEKIFQYAMHMGVRDYINRRRMTMAARDLAHNGYSVTDVAMKYQFQSVEVFSRAFRRVWFENPSAFREKYRFTDIFPPIVCIHEEDTQMLKQVDMSAAFDYMRAHSGSFVLCADVKGCMPLNQISRKLGDLAILTMAKRLESVATQDMIVMRVGGDEFALLTALTDLSAAEALREKLLAMNGETILFEGKEYPLFLWCGMTTIPQNLNLSTFFGNVIETIHNSRTE